MSSSLEPRYARILKLIADGLTSKEIAQLLGRSRQTVDSYIKELKYELANEPEAQGRLPNKATLTRIYHRLNQTPAPGSENLGASNSEDVSYDHLLILSRLLSESASISLRSGRPQITAQIASSASKELESIIQRLPAHSDYRNEFLDVLIQLLVQQGWGYSQLSPFYTNWYLDTGFDKLLHRVANVYDRKELEILAAFFMADGYSLGLDQENAVRTLQYALLAAQDFNHLWLNNVRFLGLIKLAGTWADRAEQQEAVGIDSLPEQREFWTAAGQIEEALGMASQIDVADIAYAYDRLATATAALRLPIARDYFDKARLYTTVAHATEHPVLIRDVQLVDVEIAVRKGLDPGSSLLDMEERANRAIEQAMMIGCSRLAIHLRGWFA